MKLTRANFRIPEDLSYLNCAYLSPLHKDVEQAGLNGLARKREPWRISADDFFIESNQARERFAALVHGDASGVSILPSVSYGMGVAAHNLPMGEGQHVLVLAEQFPSNYYPWQERAGAQGASIRVIDRPKSGNWTDAICRAIDDQTAVVALPHCHWTDGRLLDLVRISAACRQHNVPLALDVTQSLGVLDLDVNVIKPSFVVSAAYKWLLGPYSLAFMWVAPELRQGKPIEHNWLARKGSEQFAKLVHYREDLQGDAQRFDVGERSNFALLPMAIAALDLILAERERIWSGIKGLSDQLIQGARRRGFLLNDPLERAPHLLGLRFDGELPSDLPHVLAEKRVFVSVRGNAIRVAPHLYNDESDIEKFFAALDGVL
ncbi:MAG: aminotransferase class V-fold PLP-dependent enzyme [Acidobacteria bacterium]|nr:aminotransferase class V-fold PLP-dependent enzyme [Acidobacteriota bacterium]